MPFVAYYGDPNERIFGRVQFESKDAALMDAWNNSAYYDLHDTGVEETEVDRMWREADA